MQFSRSFLFFVLSMTLLFGIGRGWRSLTGGFRQDKIIMKEAFEKQSLPPTEEILTVLDQPFSYLDQGCQTYVFESADKQYVLKLIRYQRFEPPFWYALAKDWNFRKGYIQRQEEGKKKNLLRAIDSYDYAASTLEEESSTLYVHLDHSSFFSKPMIIKNIFGISQSLDLNSSGFILQRKAVPLKKVLLRCRRQHDVKKAQNIINSFLDVAISMQKKGFMNRDYNCIKNCGVIENEVKIIDVGSFAPFEKEEFEMRLRHFTKHFRKWAFRSYPQILPFFEEQLDHKIDELKES